MLTHHAFLCCGGSSCVPYSKKLQVLRSSCQSCCGRAMIEIYCSRIFDARSHRHEQKRILSLKYRELSVGTKSLIFFNLPPRLAWVTEFSLSGIWAQVHYRLSLGSLDYLYPVFYSSLRSLTQDFFPPRARDDDFVVLGESHSIDIFCSSPRCFFRHEEGGNVRRLIKGGFPGNGQALLKASPCPFGCCDNATTSSSFLLNQP